MYTALKRAYEGAGYDTGDYEDAAEQITWAQMCGFNVFGEIDFPLLPPTSSATPQLIFEGNSIAVIDAGGAHVCQYGSLAGYLAYSKSLNQGLTTLQLANCSMPKAILRSLSLIAQRGVYLAVYWRDHQGEHGASFESGAIFPNYWRVSSSVNLLNTRASTVTILCTSKPALLADAVARQEEHPNLSTIQLSCSRLAANYEKTLQNGIDISTEKWNELNAAAWPILVPATRQSRTGAGPG
jgi:hypothetical protein